MFKTHIPAARNAEIIWLAGHIPVEIHRIHDGINRESLCLKADDALLLLFRRNHFNAGFGNVSLCLLRVNDHGLVPSGILLK